MELFLASIFKVIFKWNEDSFFGMELVLQLESISVSNVS